VSAKSLQRVAEGKAPTRLSATTTISESVAAVGPMRDGLLGNNINTMNGSRQNLDAAVSQLERINRIADPDAATVIPLVKSYCEAYVAWADVRTKKGVKKAEFQPLEDALKERRSAVLGGIQKIISDPDYIDKVLHP
jgi:hypothetical protein